MNSEKGRGPDAKIRSISIFSRRDCEGRSVNETMANSSRGHNKKAIIKINFDYGHDVFNK
jgi:hypothetical protein